MLSFFLLIPIDTCIQPIQTQTQTIALMYTPRVCLLPFIILQTNKMCASNKSNLIPFFFGSNFTFKNRSLASLIIQQQNQLFRLYD